MKRSLTTLGVTIMLSLPVMAGGLGQQKSEEVSPGKSHGRWVQEAQETEKEYEQRMEDKGIQDQELVEPGYELYEKEEFERKQKEGF